MIATTLTKAYTDRSVFQSATYDTVCIDEASMAPLPAVYVAAGLGRRTVVMCDDFRQFAPIAQGDSEVVKRWLLRDIFVESGFTVRINADVVDPRLVMLQEQYRMHPDISGLVNEPVYRGQLIDKATPDRLGPGLKSPPSPDHAVAFYDSEPLGCWTARDGGLGAVRGSHFNLLQAQVSATLPMAAAAGGLREIRNRHAVFGPGAPHQATAGEAGCAAGSGGRHRSPLPGEREGPGHLRPGGRSADPLIAPLLRG